MATIQILPVAKRGSVSFGHVGDATPPIHLDEAEPQLYRIDFPSTDWLTPGHQMSVALEASFDGGLTWSGFGGFTDAQSGQLGKDGVAHAVMLLVSWDGRAIDVRGDITIMPPNFAWGLSVTTV